MVEDDSRKSDQIKDAIDNLTGSKGVNVADSWQSGLLMLKSDEWDFLVLDISIPQFSGKGDEGRFRHFGGMEILEELERVEKLIPFVVITGFDEIGHGEDKKSFNELKSDLLRQYPSFCRGVVRFKPSSTWRHELSLVMEAF
ncbi:response regulator [Marinihelvus fidelis]|uniref:hypothetical protein n=1 Tax=Marinihelvus fidelis TaxID=2613842 RepID=UPI00177F9473|nr:hypothetical protein [Marinihelvus fidelis]